MKEVLGKKVQVVVDRFHVAKRYRQGLDKRRTKELKRLKKELPEADYKEFKGVMWLLRKNPAELKPEELNYPRQSRGLIRGAPQRRHKTGSRSKRLAILLISPGRNAHPPAPAYECTS